MLKTGHTLILYSSGGSSREITSESLEFFQVSQKLDDLKSLKEYAKPSKSTLAHITGSDILFHEASKHVADEQSLRSREKDLLQKLQKKNISRKAAYEQGRKEAADQKRAALQSDIEMLSCSIETRKIAIGKEAGRSF